MNAYFILEREIRRLSQELESARSAHNELARKAGAALESHKNAIEQLHERVKELEQGPRGEIRVGGDFQ